MTIDELLLETNDISFADIICQNDIITDEDKNRYRQTHYALSLTKSEFQEKFPNIQPERIWYTPSFSTGCIYYNKESLAVSVFHIEAFTLMAGKNFSIERYERIFKRCEEEVASKDFRRSLMSLPDRMRLEYFTMLLKKYGVFPGLYELFFDSYTQSDYGFHGLDNQTLQTILASKTQEDNRKTEAAIKELPEVITIYRGGNSASTPWKEAYSWTLDINVANFFAARRGKETGYIAEATVPKTAIIEAFFDDDGRHEQEIIVHPDNITFVCETPVHGLDFLEEVLPQVSPIYLSYLEAMKHLRFAQESDIHGKEHQARVLLLTQIIAHMVDLPLRDRKLLAEAAIFHDTRRTNDDEDPAHGEAARSYYWRTVNKPNPIVEFLCKYHCLPDNEGYGAIANIATLKRDKERVTRLYRIFKDADGLDRIRLGGIDQLDLNQLRMKCSKELTLVARICLHNIHVE